jgi:hypothetical protein
VSRSADGSADTPPPGCDGGRERQRAASSTGPFPSDDEEPCQRGEDDADRECPPGAAVEACEHEQRELDVAHAQRRGPREAHEAEQDDDRRAGQQVFGTRACCDRQGRTDEGCRYHELVGDACSEQSPRIVSHRGIPCVAEPCRQARRCGHGHFRHAPGWIRHLTLVALALQYVCV